MARRRFDRDDGAAGENPYGGVATQASPPAAERAARERPYTTDRVEHPHHARERFGGLNWGAAFFGWLTAMGMAAILTAILSAAGAAIGLSEGSAASDNAETIGIVGGALLLLVLATAYFCGGYVAGRMSRFDGKRQGFGVWAIGLLITLALAAAAAIFGSEWNILNELNLPRIPIEEGDLATGGAIALALALVTTLLGAVRGGAKGRHYHDRVDRAAARDW
jgi:hypothetical protein